MKDGNRQESGWYGNQYGEWQGNRRADAGTYRSGRAARGKSGHPEQARRPVQEEDYEEDDWRDDAEDEEEYEEPADEKPGKEKKRSSVSLLTAIQILGCCAVLAAVLALKMTGGKTYADFRSWYTSAANDSVIAQEQMDRARRTVIGLWTTISSAGPQQPSSSGAAGSLASSQAASSQAPASSLAPASSAGPAAKQNNAAGNNASGAAGKGAPSSP